MWNKVIISWELIDYELTICTFKVVVTVEADKCEALQYAMIKTTSNAL